MKTLAVINQKGGVGKTTVTLGLAAVAGSRNMSCLVVDLDPQANATSGLGVWDAPQSVDDALATDRPGSMAMCLTPSGWSADVLDRVPDLAPSAPILAQREPQLANDPIGAQDRLSVALAGIDRDLVLIDCPPSLGLLTVNALFAADAVIVVTEPGAWAVDGVAQILHNVDRVAARRGGRPATAGLVINRVTRTRDARYWTDHLTETYPSLIAGVINQRAAITEAAAQSLPLHALTRDGTAEAVGQFESAFDTLVGQPVRAGGY